MLVSFIVVVFNEAKVLPLVKTAFDRLRLPPGFSLETIAIDGGSRDDSVTVARASGFTQVIEMPGANIPVCRNAGLRAASGAWIAFVDGDCILDPDWLLHAARLLTRHNELVLGWPASPPSPGTWVQQAWHIHWMNKNPALETDEGEQVLKREGFRMITTRNMIFHRGVADRIGGFDETLSTGEDTDFVFRATMAGIAAWGLPALKSVHLGEPDTLKKFYKQQIWHANRRAYAAIMQKSGMKSGGNAPKFAALFLVAAMLFAISAALGFLHPLLWLGLLPLPSLLLALSTRTCLRAKRFGLLIPLAILYGAYGLARSLDLIGLSPHKPSWKVGPPTQNPPVRRSLGEGGNTEHRTPSP
jgi:glycosyltransferase involved in cell wall biosynthesis